MVNPDNYTGTFFDANEIITQKIFLSVFCDSLYQITPENEDSCWTSLRELIAREKEIELVNIKISVPAEDMAETICENWYQKNEQIYKYLMEELI